MVVRGDVHGIVSTGDHATNIQAVTLPPPPPVGRVEAPDGLVKIPGRGASSWVAAPS